MTILIISTFDVDDLTAPALELMKAAITHAANNRGVKQHSMSIEAFCALAGLVSLTVEEFAALLKLASRAHVQVEAFDTEAPECDDLPYSSWTVFNKVCIDGCLFTFEVEHRTFDEKLLGSIRELKVRDRRKNRKFVLLASRKTERFDNSGLLEPGCKRISQP